MTSAEHSNRVVEIPGDWDDRVRLFQAGDEVDTFAILTRHYLVFVDTMATPELMRQLVEQIAPERGDRALLVVNTHAHYDHAWGNQLFEQPGGEYSAPIVGHSLAPARLFSAAHPYALERMRREHPGRYDEVRLVPPTVTFEGRLRIHGGDLSLDLLETPGHTEDHVSVWIPELRLLLAGDAVEHPFPHVDSPEGLRAARRSLEILDNLQPDFVLPCHGGPSDVELIRRNIAFLDAVVHDSGITYEEALALSGSDPKATPSLYESFHADAVAAARALRGTRTT